MGPADYSNRRLTIVEESTGGGGGGNRCAGSFQSRPQSLTKPIPSQWLKVQRLGHKMPTSALQEAVRTYHRAVKPLLQKYTLSAAQLQDACRAQEVRKFHVKLLKKTHPDNQTKSAVAALGL